MVVLLGCAALTPTYIYIGIIAQASCLSRHTTAMEGGSAENAGAFFCQYIPVSVAPASCLLATYRKSMYIKKGDPKAAPFRYCLNNPYMPVMYSATAAISLSDILAAMICIILLRSFPRVPALKSLSCLAT